MKSFGMRAMRSAVNHKGFSCTHAPYLVQTALDATTPKQKGIKGSVALQSYYLRRTHALTGGRIDSHRSSLQKKIWMRRDSSRLSRK